MIVSKLSLFILCLHQPVIAASRSPNKNTAAKPRSPIRAEQTNGKAGPVQGTGSADAAEVKGHRLELMMKFVCGQCWKDGLLSEPDRALKYCTSKARHRCGRTDTHTDATSKHTRTFSLSSSVCLSSAGPKTGGFYWSGLTRGRSGSQCGLYLLPRPFLNNTTWVKSK